MSHRTEGAVGVFTTDRELVVRSWDAWLARVTGLAEGDATGRPLAVLFPEIAARGHLARLRRVADGGGVEVLAPAFHEGLIPCPPREPSAHFTRMQQHVTIAPLDGGAGAPIGVVVTVEDVTARRNAERDLALALASEDDGERLRAARALGDVGGTAAGALVGVLGDRSWRVRRAAADGLARGRDESTRHALIDALRERHRDPSVLNATLTALVHAEQDVLSPLLESLVSPDADLRTYSALALGLLGDRRAVDALVHALDDADANVRFHAIEALGRIRSRAAALPLAAVAASRDFAVSFAALDSLTAIGEPSVAPRLLPLLDDELLRTAAAEALGRLAGEDAVAPLVALMDREPEVTAAVAVALATLADRLDGAETRGDEAVVEDLARSVATPATGTHLADALASASDGESLAIATVLGWLRAPGSERALAGALSHPSARAVAASALVACGARALELLLQALGAGDAGVRRVAAGALGRIGSAWAVPALIAALDDETEVAAAAAGALGAIGDARALDPLIQRLADEHSTVRQAAVEAINSLGAPELAARLPRLLEHPEPRVRESLARIAGYLGDPDVLPALLGLCDDPDESVRRAAIEQLPHFQDERALDAIGAALDAGSSGVRAAAARALAQLPWSRASSPLFRAAHDADPWVRYYAARSLGVQRSTEAVSTLVSLAAGDAIPPVRIAAVDALAQIGARDGLDTLPALADDPDPTIARQVLLAIGAADGPSASAALARALTSGDRARQLAALAALERSGAGAIVETVVPIAVAGQDAEARALALRVLERTGGSVAVEAFLAVAEDPRRTGDAVNALTSLGAADVPAVGLGLAHEDVAVRCAVIEALGRMSHPAVSPLLASALHRGDDATRVAATYALSRRDLRAARTTGTMSTDAE